MITDLLKFTIKEGHTEEAIKLFTEQMKNNLGDEGCMMSKAFQSQTKTNEIFLLLCWENQQAIDKHLQTDHDLAFRSKLDPIIIGPPDRLDWETISSINNPA